MLRYLTTLSLGLLAILAVPGVASAADPSGYPSRPVRIVVPFTPGGSPDVLARALGQKLSEAWGQPVVIENRPGAGGNIAADVVAKANADGYTLLMGTDGPIAINPFLYDRLPFDPVRDFAPVALLASVDFMLVTHPSFPAKDVKGLIDLARQQRPAFTYGSSGNGSQHHLGMELFKSQAGIELVHIPYKGVVPAMTDVMSGHTPMMFSAVPSAAQHVRAGKLQALAVSGPHRSALVPDIPTMEESGVPGFLLQAWFGLLAPAGTPPAVIARINDEANRVLKMRDIKAHLEGIGFGLRADSPAGFGAFIKSEQERWKAVVRASGARIG